MLLGPNCCPTNTLEWSLSLLCPLGPASVLAARLILEEGEMLRVEKGNYLRKGGGLPSDFRIIL